MGLLYKNILDAISKRILVTVYCDFGVYTGFITNIDKPTSDDPYIEILYMDYVQNNEGARINKDISEGMFELEELEINEELKEQLENPDKFFTRRIFSLGDLQYIDFGVEHSLNFNESLFIKNYRDSMVKLEEQKPKRKQPKEETNRRVAKKPVKRQRAFNENNNSSGEN